MVKKEDADLLKIEEDLEEAKQPKRGRPRREVTDEEAFRKLMIQQAKAQTRALKAMKAMLSQVSGGRYFGKQCMFGSYFLPMWGLPGADAVMAEANRLLSEWTSEGWYPVHVTSQPGELQFAEGGSMRGQDVTILWGHD